MGDLSEKDNEDFIELSKGIFLPAHPQFGAMSYDEWMKIIIKRRTPDSDLFTHLIKSVRGNIEYSPTTSEVRFAGKRKFVADVPYLKLDFDTGK